MLRQGLVKGGLSGPGPLSVDENNQKIARERELLQVQTFKPVSPGLFSISHRIRIDTLVIKITTLVQGRGTFLQVKETEGHV